MSRDQLPTLRPVHLDFPGLGRPTRQPVRQQEIGTRSREAVAIAAVLSLFAISLIGFVGVILFLAIGGLLAILIRKELWATIKRSGFLLLFPLLGMLSTLWSDAPQLTLRAGVQLAITLLLAILAVSTLPPRKLIGAAFLGTLAMILSTLPSLPAALSSSTPLASELLGSKNQIGFAAFMMFLTGAAMLCDRDQSRAIRLAGFLAIPLSFIVVFLSRSAGGLVSIMIGLILFGSFASLTLVGPRLRALLVGTALIMLGTAFVYREEVETWINSFRSEVLEKSETLTGRTHLWEIASNLWSERPLLGYGYEAFWRVGNLEAEGLWRWGGVSSAVGFNFHNVVVETKINLGIVGLGVILVTCILVTVPSLFQQLRRPTVAGAFFLTLQLVLYMRGTIESGLIGQFSSLTLLWAAGAVYTREARYQRSLEPWLDGPRPRLRV